MELAFDFQYFYIIQVEHSNLSLWASSLLQQFHLAEFSGAILVLQQKLWGKN